MGKQSTQRPTDAAIAKAQTVSQAAIKAENSRKAAETATRNAQYFEDNAARQKADLEFNRKLAAGPAGKAGVDLGLIPMGIKVLATGAAVIASGGVVAGGIGLTAGGGAIAAAGAADQLIAAVERGGAIAKDAKAAIDTVKDAAKKGDAAAKAAVKVIGEVADERKLKGVAAGAVQGLSAEAGKIVGNVKAAVSGGLDTNALLKAATAAAAAGAKPDPKTTLAVSSTFSKAQKDGLITVTKQPSKILDSIAPASKLWLVTDGGKVINLEAQPSSASSRGWAVYSNGKVVHQ
jgi:hypothetical protein